MGLTASVPAGLVGGLVAGIVFAEEDREERNEDRETYPGAEWKDADDDTRLFLSLWPLIGDRARGL